MYSELQELNEKMEGLLKEAYKMGFNKGWDTVKELNELAEESESDTEE